MELKVGDRIKIKKDCRRYYVLRDLQQKRGYLIVSGIHNPCPMILFCQKVCTNQRTYSFHGDPGFWCYDEENVEKISLCARISLPKTFKEFHNEEPEKSWI